MPKIINNCQKVGKVAKNRQKYQISKEKNYRKKVEKCQVSALFFPKISWFWPELTLCDTILVTWTTTIGCWQLFTMLCCKIYPFLAVAFTLHTDLYIVVNENLYIMSNESMCLCHKVTTVTTHILLLCICHIVGSKPIWNGLWNLNV